MHDVHWKFIHTLTTLRNGLVEVATTYGPLESWSRIVLSAPPILVDYNDRIVVPIAALLMMLWASIIDLLFGLVAGRGAQSRYDGRPHCIRRRGGGLIDRITRSGRGETHLN